MGEDVRRLIDMLEEASDFRDAAGDCVPPLDVLETAAGIEIVMDLPGLTADGVQVVFARNVLVIAGQKHPASCEHHQEAAFHLAERTFGRFARAVRVSGAFDAGAAVATLRGGELRIVLPRIDERRGREIRIPVRAD